MPVTSVERTLIDLAAVAHPRTVESAFEAARRRGLVTGESIWKRLAVMPEVEGASTLVALLDRHAAATESVLETRTWQVLRDSGLPLPERQFVVRGPDGFVARVDFAYPQIKLAIEADGYEFHSRERDWKKDLARQNELILLGWTILRVTWDDIVRNPRGFVERVARLLKQRP